MTDAAAVQGPRRGASLRRGVSLIAAAGLVTVSAIIIGYAEFRGGLLRDRHETAWLEVQAELVQAMLDLYGERLGGVARQASLAPEVDATLLGDGGAADPAAALQRARERIPEQPEILVLSAGGEVLAATADAEGFLGAGAIEEPDSPFARTSVAIGNPDSPILFHQAPVRRGDSVIGQVVALLEISDAVANFFPGLDGLAFVDGAGRLRPLAGNVPFGGEAFGAADGQARARFLRGSESMRFEAATLPLRDDAGAVVGDFVFLRDVTEALRREELLAKLAFSAVVAITLLSLGLLVRSLRHGFRPLGAVVYMLEAMAKGDTRLRMRGLAVDPAEGGDPDGARQEDAPAESASEIDTLLDSVERFRASVDTRNALIAVQEQLSNASRIQQSLLPDRLGLHPKLDIHARMRPAQDIGGDFFDAFTLDNGQIAVVIADVSGKGVGPALFAAQASALLRSHCNLPEQLAEQVSFVNSTLVERNVEEMFLTAIVAVITPETGEISYVNAGHCPPMIAGADGEVRIERTKPDLVLGVLPGMDWSLHRLSVKPGEILLFHSDGFDEAESSGGEMLGRERAMEIFAEAVAEHAASPDAEGKDLTGRVIDRIDAFADGAPQTDDITLMTIRRKE